MKTPVWAPVALICSVVVNALLLSVYFSADESTTAALLGKQDGVGPPAREDKLMFLPDKYHFVENSIKRILYSPAAKVLPAAPSITRNTQLHDAPVDVRSGAFFDPSLRAFVNPALLSDLHDMNKLQGSVNARKWEALRAADSQLASPTSGAGKERVDPAPLIALRSALFQWGAKNPVTGTPRVDCSDSLADASTNGAAADRFLSPSDCASAAGGAACGVGRTFTVECPPGCVRRGGEVFGAGTRSNPFMDLSSICKAALVSGLAGGNSSPSLVTFEVVAPAASYTGVSKGAITTLDYSTAKEKEQALHGYGGRAFIVLQEGTSALALEEEDAGAQDKAGAADGKAERARILKISQAAPQLSQASDFAQTLPSQSNHVLSCSGSGHGTARELGAAGGRLNGTSSLTVEVWVRDAKMGDEAGYVTAGGSFSEGWGHPFVEYGFALGMHKGQFAFGIAAEETGVMDWVVAPDWLSQPNKGEWVHLAGTYDGEAMLLYVNGMFVGCGHAERGAVIWPSTPDAATTARLSAVTLGAIRGRAGEVDGASRLQGELDEVRIWDSVRTQEELFRDMHLTLQPAFGAPFPDGLALYWRFDFDADNCKHGWLPCGQTCDETAQVHAELTGCAVVPAAHGLAVEMLSVARGCIRCPRYPAVENGRVSGETDVDEHASIRCNDKFQPFLGAGVKVTPDWLHPVCGWDMAWEPAVIECRATCPMDAPDHGYLTSATKVVFRNSIVELKCNKGFELAPGSRSKALCGWNVFKRKPFFLPKLGACIATCPVYPPAEHGTTPDDTKHAGQDIRVECDKGFVMDPPIDYGRISCQDDGTYSVPDFTCKATCPGFPVLHHGERDPTGQTLQGDVVALSCVPGFTLADSSHAEATCVAYDPKSEEYTGEYSPRAEDVRCVADCSPYDAGPHGIVTPAGPTIEGDKVAITCEDGFQLDTKTPDAATCVATWKGGEYDRTGSVCVAACGAYPPVQHGSTKGPALTGAGDKVYIVCELGHDLSFDSSSVATCQDDGTFDYPTAECVPTCPAYPTLAHGTLSMTGPTQLGDRVELTCDKGWELDDPTKTPADCLAYSAKGDWTGEYSPDPKGAACVQRCDTYDAGEHGIVTPAGVIRAGESVSITCDKGFVLDPKTPSYARCTSTWKGAVFDREGSACVAQCGPYPITDHGRASGPKAPIAGQTIAVSCDYGHLLSKSSAATVTCQADGTYDYPSATCEAFCPALPSPQHASVSPSGPTQIGDVVDITCDKGWELEGDIASPARCVAYSAKGSYTGEYDPDAKAFSCVQMCDPYEDIEHGSIEPAGKVGAGRFVTITCDKGFALSPESYKSVRCVGSSKGAAFDHSTAACLAICPRYPDVEHGTYKGENEPVVGDVVTIRCDDGHQLSPKSSSTATCQADGSWDAPTASCEAFCPPHPTLAYGSISTGVKTTVGEEVVLECNKGYTLSNPKLSPATCVAYSAKGAYTGEYSPEGDAECVQYCDAYTPPENGAVEPKGVALPGALVTITCNEGYVLSGKSSSTSTCTAGIFSAGFTPLGASCEAVVAKGEPVPTEVPGPPTLGVPEPDINWDLPPLKAGMLDNSGKGVLMGECGEWRDKKRAMTEGQQLATYTRCMAQDCGLSLINNGIGTVVGCRFMDENGFCYAYGAAQLWCVANPKSGYCQNDGGEDWGWADAKMGTAEGTVTEWTPQKDVPLYDEDTGNVKATFSCACMKNCNCDAKYGRTSGSCRCLDGPDAKVTGDQTELFPPVYKRTDSNKRGACSCYCNHRFGT